MTRSIPRNEARNLIVETALAHMGRLGPAHVHPKEICEELGLSKALVNYHFGGRDALIAEAMMVGYERYVDELWFAAESAGVDPVERLIAWVDRLADWTVAHPGLAAALNFPVVAAGAPTGIDESAALRINAAVARNLANLQSLVAEAKRAARGNRDAPPPDDREIGLDSAVIGWMAVGHSVREAGNYLSTQHPDRPEGVSAAREHLRNEIVAVLDR